MVATRASTPASAALPPLALYVHFPWCVRKCPYCDFNSHALDGGQPPEARYLEALLADLDATREDNASRPITSVFLGGGTPSLFRPDTVARLIERLRERGLLEDAEITLEANPGTVERARFEGYRAAGVTRLSIGVQSFHDGALARLGRIHDGDDARRAIEAALAAGFAHVNADLMHGLPGQTSAEAIADLSMAVAAGVDHVSFYQLTIEPNTAFYRRPPRLPGEDTLAAIEDCGFERLERAGFERYEVSAWARTPRDRCRHNLNYWRFGDYLGIGAGAHGKLTRVDGDGRLRVTRTRRTRMPGDYLAPGGARPSAVASVDAAALPGEFMMNALRLVDGVEPALFEQRTGLPLATLQPIRDRLIEAELMRRDRLAATSRGFDLLNRVIAAFLAP